MGKVSDFIAYLLPKGGVDIYVSGGQNHLITSEADIRRLDTDSEEDRAIALYRKRLAAGAKPPIHASDCSGLGVWWFLQKGYIAKDRTAHGLMGLCKRIPMTEAKPGCQVFRLDNGHAYHIGYVVSESGDVVESANHDKGVIKSNLHRNPWDVCGIPPYFADEIEGVQEDEPMIKYGDDTSEVKAYQNALLNLGYTLPRYGADGEWGEETQTAHVKFQADHGIPASRAVDLATQVALFALVEPAGEDDAMAAQIKALSSAKVELETKIQNAKVALG